MQCIDADWQKDLFQALTFNDWSADQLFEQNNNTISLSKFVHECTFADRSAFWLLSGWAEKTPN